MKAITDFDVFAKQVATHTNELLKLEWTINSGGAAALFVQIHDSATTPAEGDVPLKSWPTAGSGTGYKEFKNGELHITKGLYVCVSTTEGTKTLGTGSNKFSTFMAEITQTDEPSGTTIAGDYTTNVQSLTIWATGQVHQLLALEVDATGVAAGTYYIQLFAGPAVNGDKPIAQWPIDNDEVFTKANAIRFGRYGREVMELTAPNTLRTGCRVKISTTSGVCTQTTENFKIRAEYK